MSEHTTAAAQMAHDMRVAYPDDKNVALEAAILMARTATDSRGLLVHLPAHSWKAARDMIATYADAFRYDAHFGGVAGERATIRNMRLLLDVIEAYLDVAEPNLP